MPIALCALAGVPPIIPSNAFWLLGRRCRSPPGASLPLARSPMETSAVESLSGSTRDAWSVSTSSASMQTTRVTIDASLKRWATAGQEGIEDQLPAPTRPTRKVTFGDIQEVRRLARNPEIGAYRVMAALERSPEGSSEEELDFAL